MNFVTSVANAIWKSPRPPRRAREAALRTQADERLERAGVAGDLVVADHGSPVYIGLAQHNTGASIAGRVYCYQAVFPNNQLMPGLSGIMT